jgi:hypothetical protein
MAQAVVLSPEDSELILEFDLESGHNADAVVAAEALIAWVSAIRETNAILDPLSDVRVDLVSAEAACLRLRAALRFVEHKVLGPPADALSEFPRIKKIVVATVLGATGGVAAAGAGMLVLPDQTVKLSPHGNKVLIESQQRVQQEPVVHKQVQQFYRTIEKDRRITAVSVTEKIGQPPLLKVPRAEFPERSGLWLPPEAEPLMRPAGGIWEVVVTHPVLKGEPRVWGFIRDGLPFRAKVTDARFLSAIRSKTLPLPIQEGVTMIVQVRFLEHFDGDVWAPVPNSWEIPAVIDPAPLVPGSAPTSR